jgi:ABC-2 type transport system ATP-binding protein
MNQHTVIEARKLRKRYGSHLVVNDISFSVFEGEIFGLTGPNGAGKTTTMECIVVVQNAAQDTETTDITVVMNWVKQFEGHE